MLITCPECGHQVSDQAKTCPSCGIEIAGKVMSPAQRKRRTVLTVTIVSFVIVLILVLLGLYFVRHQEQENEMRAYQTALKSNEPQVLQNYLDMYADAPVSHRDSICICLDALLKVDGDWTEAILNNTRYAFERFLKLHPQSIHAVEADIKIDSIDWIDAINLNTIEAFQTYLARHNNGSYYDEALAKLEQFEEEQRHQMLDSLNQQRQLPLDSVEAQQLTTDSLFAELNTTHSVISNQ